MRRRSPFGMLALAVLAGSVSAASLAEAQGAPANTLSAAEREAGWRPLFNGRDFTGWRGLGRDSVATAHWTVQDGAIRKVPTSSVPLGANGRPLPGGDLVTVESFGDFEFAFEWKLAPGGNSGV